MNPDGSDIVQLTSLAPTLDSSWVPSISPDGRKVAFDYGPTGSNGNPLPDLYVINMDGSGLVRLTKDKRSWFPRWSPDGTRIIFAHTSTRTGNNVITTMAADGTGRRTELTTDVWDNIAVAYAPDGKRIVFYSQLGGFVSTVWIMNADGSHKRRLTDPALEGFPWDVSPDGQHILLSNHQNSPVVLSNSIFVMNIDGNHLKQLTALGRLHHDLYPSFSPDATKIAFASDRLSSDASLDIFTMSADGSNITPTATGLTAGGCPGGNCVTPLWGSPLSAVDDGAVGYLKDRPDGFALTDVGRARRCLPKGMECLPHIHCCPDLVCVYGGNRMFCEP